MNFKQNWDKWVKALLMTIAAVIFLIAVFGMEKTVMPKDAAGFDDAEVSIGLLALYVAGFVFFAAMAYIQVMKALDKEAFKFTYLIVGAVGTIAALIFLFMPVMYNVTESAKALKVVNDTGLDLLFNEKAFTLAPYVTMIFVFGFLPLVKGIKKAFCDKETTTAK